MPAPNRERKYRSRLKPTTESKALKATKCVGCEAEIARLDQAAREAETAAERDALGRQAAALMAQRYLTPEEVARRQWWCVRHVDPEGYTERLALAQQEAKARCASAYARASEPKQEELF